MVPGLRQGAFMRACILVESGYDPHPHVTPQTVADVPLAVLSFGRLWRARMASRRPGAGGQCHASGAAAIFGPPLVVSKMFGTSHAVFRRQDPRGLPALRPLARVTKGATYANRWLEQHRERRVSRPRHAAKGSFGPGKNRGDIFRGRRREAYLPHQDRALRRSRRFGGAEPSDSTCFAKLATELNSSPRP